MDRQAYSEMAELQEAHWWFQARRQIIASLIGSLPTGPDTKILEVGSGPGGNLAMLESFGSVAAMEMDEHAINIAKPHHKSVTFYKGKCPEDCALIDGQFDLIAMLDVLEHIDLDDVTLGSLREILNPNGQVLITVPAYQWMWSRHDEYLHHRRRYTRARLADVVSSSGFKVKKISYFNSLLFPLAVVARVSDKITRAEQSTGNAMPPAILNACLRGIFSFERHLLKRTSLPFGLSLFCIAEK